MTTNLQEIINQCDDISLMEDATILSISGAKSQVLTQLGEIKNTLESINCLITHIEDDSTGYEEQDYAAYSIYTDLPLIKFNQLVTSSKQPHKEKNMHNTELSKSQKLAGYIASNVAKEPLDFLLEQNARLDNFEGGPMFSYHTDDKFIVIKCEEEGDFIVAVYDKEDSMEIALGFSEKLSILTYLMYEDLLAEENSGSNKLDLNDAA